MTIKQQQKNPRPFLKWAGGKGQIVEEIANRLPTDILKYKKINKYFEPFLGGGAVYFWLYSNFGIKKSYLYDINPEIITAYQVIQQKVNKLISELEDLEQEYLKLNGDRKERYFYDRRDEYNDFIAEKYKNHKTRRTALIIFLNKTCFNGLFRVNSKGLFNVPFGRYSNPTICDEENLKAVSEALQHAEIEKGDFADCLDKADTKSLVYFDPPYRPISQTSSFTGYIKGGFSDDDQKRLKEVCDQLKQKHAKVILSNSDPKNINPKDNFFDELFHGYKILRVAATRMINSNATKRGEINELLVTSY